ncbi:hypothetical protein TNCV_1854201 [Trichonephila clavipes]|nr:hypothetical protein TNCV_1854201 [Trichonephila clavipes]
MTTDWLLFYRADDFRLNVEEGGMCFIESHCRKAFQRREGRADTAVMMFYGRKRRRGHSHPLMEHENANNSIPEVFMNWTQCINVKSLPWREVCGNSSV